MIKNNNISVTIKFFIDLLEFGPPKTETKMPIGSSINSIIKQYKIPIEKKKLIILINGIPQYDCKIALKNGDTIVFFPPLAGG